VIIIGRILCALGLHSPKLHRWGHANVVWFVSCERDGCYWTKEVRR
jgi:hypothetical protein